MAVHSLVSHINHLLKTENLRGDTTRGIRDKAPQWSPQAPSANELVLFYTSDNNHTWRVFSLVSATGTALSKPMKGNFCFEIKICLCFPPSSCITNHYIPLKHKKVLFICCISCSHSCAVCSSLVLLRIVDGRLRAQACHPRKKYYSDIIMCMV